MNPRMKSLAVLGLMLLGACDQQVMEPTATDVQSAANAPAPSLTVVSNVFTSGTNVTTWDAIPESNQPASWGSTFCVASPAVGPGANWQNPHNAYVLSGHPWAGTGGSDFDAPWINAWNDLSSSGSGGTSPYYNWTRYDTQVSGNGTFVLRLLADNCSWVYLDGVLVGRQADNWYWTSSTDNNMSYGVTLNGTHTLSFIIFDGGGAAGGKFILETTSNPPEPLNPDLDGDGHVNDQDAFPLDPTEWADSDGDGVGDNADAFPNDPSETVDTDGDGVGDNADVEPTLNNNYYWVDWTSADVAGGTAEGTITLGDGSTVSVSLKAVRSDGSHGSLFGYEVTPGVGVTFAGWTDFWTHDNNSPQNDLTTTYKSGYVLNSPDFPDIIGLSGGNTDSYVLTFSSPVQDPVMDIMSLGQGGDASVYSFSRSFEIVSQGIGRFGGSNTSLRVRNAPDGATVGDQVQGNEGNGTLRFVGELSNLSWTVPDGETWHGFTIGVRGAGNANGDYDGDGVLDAADNCPTVSNGSQADSDYDGIGDACDTSNDPNADTDGDGLSNSDEHAIGTDPTNPDTDGDGYNDGVDAYPKDPTRHEFAPPTADIGGPYAGNEGSAIAFDGSGSSDADGHALTYAWSFGDGATGTGATPSHTYADNDTYTVTLTVDDGHGGTSTATTTAEVSNVAPTATASAGGTLESGGSFSFTGTFTDPGADAWTESIDWGDGSAAESGSSGSHTYLAPATYTVTYTVTDDDGGVGTATATVTVTRKNILIDVKPGSEEDPVNINDKGVTPVAILTANGFDATTIDRTTIRFGVGEATPVHKSLGHVEDVDNDGDMDLMTHFTTGETGLQDGDTSVCLIGTTAGGVQFKGCDVVRAFAQDNNAGGKGKGKGK